MMYMMYYFIGVNFSEKIEIELKLQYNRRESIEIHGIPQEVNDNELEGKCLDISRTHTEIT